MADGDIFELTVHCQTAQLNQFVNTFGFKQVGAVAGDPAATLASDFQTNVLDEYVAPMTSTLSAYKIRVEWIVPSTPASYDLAVSPAVPGGAGGDSLPFQDAAVITIRTALKGRSFRGRVYMPPTGELNQSGGNLTAGVVTAYQAFVTAMVGRYITNAATSHFQWGVISRVANGVTRVPPIITNTLTAEVRPTIYSQRRRQLGRGA